jgi:hypothetical protein
MKSYKSEAVFYKEDINKVERKLSFNYIYHPFCKGYRDSLGVPEEPDEPAHFEILDFYVDGEYKTDQETEEIFGMDWEALDEWLQEALFDEQENY